MFYAMHTFSFFIPKIRRAHIAIQAHEMSHVSSLLNKPFKLFPKPETTEKEMTHLLNINGKT